MSPGPWEADRRRDRERLRESEIVVREALTDMAVCCRADLGLDLGIEINF